MAHPFDRIEPNRFASIYLTTAFRQAPELLHRAWIRRHGPPPADKSARAVQRNVIGGDVENGYVWLKSESRIWFRKPSHWRDEMITGNHTSVTVIRGDESSVYIPARNLYSSINVPVEMAGKDASEMSLTIQARLAGSTIRVFDLSRFRSDWRLRETGSTNHCGMHVLIVRATRTSEPDRNDSDTIDEYELFVSEERGIILRCAGLVDGEIANEMSVAAVAFDEPVPDELFRMTPREP